MSSPRDRSGPQIFLVVLALVAFVALVGGVSHIDEPARPPAPPTPSHSAVPGLAGKSRPAPALPLPSVSADPVTSSALPGGGRRIFADGRLLVAYYGTAGTGSLGVLGEAGPDRIVPRLVQAA